MSGKDVVTTCLQRQCTHWEENSCSKGYVIWLLNEVNLSKNTVRIAGGHHDALIMILKCMTYTF